MPVATIDEISTALQRTIGKKGLNPDDIAKISKFLVTFFGFHEEVLDNHLKPDDRDIFYMLEEEGLCNYLLVNQRKVELKVVG